MFKFYFVVLFSILSFSNFAQAEDSLIFTHFLVSNKGGETIRIMEKYGSSQVYYLIDRCDVNKSHCAPLLPGKEKVTYNDLSDQKLSFKIKGDLVQHGMPLLSVFAMIGGRQLALAGLASVVGTAAAPFVLTIGSILGVGSLGYKGARWIYRDQQLDTVQKLSDYNSDDERVFSIWSYDKALTDVVAKSGQPEQRAIATNPNQ